MTIRIPPQLADAVDEDDYPERLEWLAALPALVTEMASGWELELGDPYLPGGQCAWVAPARNPAGDEIVLKVGWRHREAEHEADALPQARRAAARVWGAAPDGIVGRRAADQASARTGAGDRQVARESLPEDRAHPARRDLTKAAQRRRRAPGRVGRKRGGGSRPALANAAGGGARARRAAAQSPAARPASDAEPLAAPWRRIGVGISPKQHPNHRRPETSIGAQAGAPGRGQPVQPPAGVPGAAHQTFALAASQDVMKDHLAGRLLTQTPDLHGGASGAKRTAMNRSKHRELDVTQRIAASHRPSLRPRRSAAAIDVRASGPSARRRLRSVSQA